MEQQMTNLKVAAGVILTAGATAQSWVEQANTYGQLVITGVGILVAILTVWYTWERAMKLRKERKEKT
jgi:hypothetical protein